MSADSPFAPARRRVVRRELISAEQLKGRRTHRFLLLRGLQSSQRLVQRDQLVLRIPTEQRALLIRLWRLRRRVADLVRVGKDHIHQLDKVLVPLHSVSLDDRPLGARETCSDDFDE
jgi:hypothetical protein